MGTKLLNLHPSVWEKLRLKANTATDAGSGQLTIGADKRQWLHAAESSEIRVRLRVFCIACHMYLMSMLISPFKKNTVGQVQNRGCII